MNSGQFPPEFLKLLRNVKAKRPKTVIDHVLKFGRITTEDLKNIYGYNHPPRAIRDVREQGIPIETFRVTGTDGRKIAAYKFGSPENVRTTQRSGRTAFTTKLKTALVQKYGSRCNVYLEDFPLNELQIDHRIPFEIAGDHDLSSDEETQYMLLCASANRAKSWSCENCANWQPKVVEVCMSCYWTYPESYTHIATREIRRADLLWAGKEIADYDDLVQAAAQSKGGIPEYAKAVLRQHLKIKKK